ncbi:MAG: threonine-phosphate decarboxylase [Chloroflexota bacterium]
MSHGTHGVVHGGMREDELLALGIDPTGVVDLSANLHPSGPDPAVLAAARIARLDQYPPPDAAPLRDAIAEAHGLDPATVLVTPGATAALHLLARAYVRRSEVASIAGPTFGEYRAAIMAAGGEVVEHQAVAPDFAPDLDALSEGKPQLMYLCLPNNPTGAYLQRDQVCALLDRLADNQLLVLDAAYAPFVQGAWDIDALVAEGRHTVVVHSLTKLHAVPGLRLGYIVAPVGVIERLRPLVPSWSIDAASLGAGMVAVTQHTKRIALLEATWRVREELRSHCEALGLVVAPGRANFLTVRTGHGATARERLMREGFVVRDCASFGLPDWIRIAVPREEDLSALKLALTAALGESTTPVDTT